MCVREREREEEEGKRREVINGAIKSDKLQFNTCIRALAIKMYGDINYSALHTPL